MRATLAVILARGLGSRLRAEDGESALGDHQREAAALGAKGLMPIRGRPFLDYVLHELADAGVRDVVFVVARDDEAIRRRYADESPPSRIRVRFAVQDKPLGTAHALLAAREAVLAPIGAPRDEDGVRHFLVCNSDDLYPAASIRALVELEGPGLIAFSAEGLTDGGVLDAPRIQRFALLDLGPDGSLLDVVEKPAADHPLSRRPERWVSMNLWRFTNAIFADCAAVTPSPRGELELVDAVRRGMAAGKRYAAVRQHVLVPDLTHRRDVPALEALLEGWTPRP